jgi:hypothetical protein
LIDDKPEEVIDLSSIKELTQTRYEIKMPSFEYSMILQRADVVFHLNGQFVLQARKAWRNHRKKFAGPHQMACRK